MRSSGVIFLSLTAERSIGVRPWYPATVPACIASGAGVVLAAVSGFLDNDEDQISGLHSAAQARIWESHLSIV
jgi:hypothetical protein